MVGNLCNDLMLLWKNTNKKYIIFEGKINLIIKQINYLNFYLQQKINFKLKFTTK